MAAPGVSGEHWSSRFGFLMAAIGSSVGLGNFWRFPYTAGENGGAIFVLAYLICILLVGFPVLVAEYTIGRRGGKSAIGSVRAVAKESGSSQLWAALGWFGMAGAFIVLSYYSVIAGWVTIYIFKSFAGDFAALTPDQIAAEFGAVTSNKPIAIGAHAVFMGLTAFLVARGINNGIEAATKILMPAFFVMLVIVVVFGFFTGDVAGAASYLFRPDFGAFTDPETGAFAPGRVMSAFSAALGQAFFSIGLGFGLMITYGAYLQKNMRVIDNAAIVAGSDTFVALIAGLAVFPIVFGFGLDPAGGAGLFFVTLPVAFSQMPPLLGVVFGGVFFTLAFFVAITSSISLLEVSVSWADDHKGFPRRRAALILGFLCWLLGLASVYSGAFFDLMDYLTEKIMLPFGGLMVAVFAGWFIRREFLRDELSGASDGAFKYWRFLIKWVAPIGTVAIFAASVYAFVEAAPGLFGAFSQG